MTRRPPRPSQPAAADAAPVSTDAPAGLVLRRTAGANTPVGTAPATPAAPPPPRLAPVPAAREDHTLTDAAPAIRLTPITSGIGSLRISHADLAAWETTDLTGAHLGDGTPAPTSGNRPLIERDGAGLLVSLRHIRSLRRLIIAGTDTTIRTIAGLTISNPGTAVTALSVIDGQIEIRREPATPDLQNTYSIGVVA